MEHDEPKITLTGEFFRRVLKALILDLADEGVPPSALVKPIKIWKLLKEGTE
ncbi:MAG: hypothetical protein NC299_11830 [Lachnospiraceae bacterium]|nr:hypothetical protein [Lachnospiraceae bacterium]